MNNPPAPVFGNGQVRLASPHQACTVESRNGDGGDEEHGEQGTALRSGLEGGHQGARHQEQPDHQADEEEQLPEPAEVNIFISLVSQPEILDQSELLHHAEPLTDQRSHNDHEEGQEQEVDTQSLESGFLATHCGCQVKSRGQPGGCDPENGQLDVPRTGNGIWQDARQRQAVECLSLHPVMRRNDAHQDLNEDQGRHDPEILQCCLH